MQQMFWKIGVRTRWDLWSENNWLGRLFMEVLVFVWWWTSHQSSAHKGPRLFRFCIVSWLDNSSGIFPGFNTLQLSQEVKELLLKFGETPENFIGRIFFMSMFIDISWGPNGCRIPECCWFGQYFMTKFCQVMKKHLNQKVVSEEHPNWARIGSENFLFVR